MKRQSVLVLAVIGMMMFAGCASLISSRDNSAETTETTSVTTQETTESPETTETDETTTEEETTSTTTTTTTTTTTKESWSPPERPNRPLEKAYEERGENHIRDVEVGGEGSTDEGYSSVELTVRANTSWQNIDPEDRGSVEGEPFILVYINGHLATSNDTRFATPRGVIGARSPQLELQENGQFTITVPQEAFEASGVEPGDDVELMVLVMDRDKEWDDIFGKQVVEFTYNPDA